MIGARVMHGSWPHGALSNLSGGQVLAVCFIGAFVCVAFYFMGRYKQHLDILRHYYNTSSQHNKNPTHKQQYITSHHHN